MNGIEFDSIWWKLAIFASYQETTYYVRIANRFFPSEQRSISHNPLLTTTIVDEDDGVHSLVRTAASF